jgi:hypothetical protein
MTAADEPSFTCPRCGRTSHHPDDARNGYCGACHDWTGQREPVDVWRVERNVCGWCSEAIQSTAMAIFPSTRITLVWTHVASGHERCTGRDTFATPANLRAP